MHFIGVKWNMWHLYIAVPVINLMHQRSAIEFRGGSREGERSPAGVKLPGLARFSQILQLTRLHRVGWGTWLGALLLGLLGSGGVLPHLACLEPEQLDTFKDSLLLKNIHISESACMWNQDVTVQSLLSCSGLSGSQLVLQQVNWSPLETLQT